MIRLAEKAALGVLHQFEPETAHGLALMLLRAGLGPNRPPLHSPRLATRLAGLDLPNPLGVAAGFDKNAVALKSLSRVGFGFLEVGGATPLPQPGNRRPRLFRLSQDRAVINRFGFNNDGAEVIAARLARRPRGGVLGINIGANKTSPDRALDFVRVLHLTGPHVDFATVNVSSPNTERLRQLQGAEALTALLSGVMEARTALPRPLPIFLKIAPDLDLAALDSIARVAQETGVDAIIATNTTLAREGLTSPARREAGGLSGAPVFHASTVRLAQLYQRVGGDIPLIGVGGISTAEDAFEKVRAGASALQLYSALVFSGLSLVPDLLKGLEARLAKENFATVAEAVGTGADDWARR